MAISSAKIIQEVNNYVVHSVKSFERIKVNTIEKKIVKNYIVLYDSQLKEVKYRY